MSGLNVGGSGNVSNCIGDGKREDAVESTERQIGTGRAYRVR